MIEFNEIDGKIAVIVDKNNLVRVDWVVVEQHVNDYMKGDKNSTNCWCFVLWNVKHNQARSLND